MDQSVTNIIQIRKKKKKKKKKKNKHFSVPFFNSFKRGLRISFY